jgi:hypothetical protein
MPFLLKTFIKTNLLLLLFTLVNIELLASIMVNNYQIRNNFDITCSTISPEAISSFIEPGDTITKVKNDTQTTKAEEEFVIPNSLIGRRIDFQVNSDITYLSFRHFVKNESKKVFFQAWLLEKELHKLTRKTDSLRKTYANATSEQKEAMSTNILKMERRTIDLNNEIPVLYQKARNEENQYWKSVSEKEIASFQEKVKSFSDSIDQSNRKINEQTLTKNEPLTDTLYLEKEQTKTTVSKPETSSEIAYKIQIGAYKGKIPEPANKLIKKLSVIRKVENYLDNKGVKVFTTGNLRNYNEAIILQSQVKQEGVKNPIIAAYLKGKRITVAEARKLNNEL